MRRHLLAITLFLLPAILGANDGAASMAAGGLRLKAERRVALISEKLFISKTEVRVDYAFQNTTNREVVTEVAFPIPEYGLGQELSYRPVNRFELRMDGRALPCEAQIQAWAGGKDLTRLLASMGVDIEHFARIQYSPESTHFPSQIKKLSEGDRRRLRRAGAIDPADDVPKWTVRKTYHWTQRFPAGKVIHLAHSYLPVSGYTVGATLEELAAPQAGANLQPGCPDQSLRDWVSRRLAARPAEAQGFMKDRFHLAWVQYILTTANTWKTPIRDFQLDVEGDPDERVTFCWDGPVESVAPNRARALVKNFIPARELTVYFLKP